MSAPRTARGAGTVPAAGVAPADVVADDPVADVIADNPVADLAAAARAGTLGADPAAAVVSVGFVTRQGARHPGRNRAYRNEVLSLRVGAAVGSCAVEPGQLADGVADECVGHRVAALLDHPLAPVRCAALDAFLLATRPPAQAAAQGAAEAVTVPAGDSLAKSTARAAAVVALLPVRAGQRVLVVGVVDSLLARLRQHGVRYVPCDRAGGVTEWGEPVLPDAATVLETPSAAGDAGFDALLVSGMTLGNGTFPGLAAAARRAGVPLVVFAQSGSGLAPWLCAAGVTAVCAEPFPFFYIHGGPTVLYRYRSPESRPAPASGTEVAR